MVLYDAGGRETVRERNRAAGETVKRRERTAGGTLAGENGGASDQADCGRLTEKDKSVLDYIMKYRETACFMAAAEIAGILGVSPSCVVRLAGKLGFSSYGQFKRYLQEEMAVRRREERGEVIPYERIKEYESLTDGEMLKALTQNIRGNLDLDLDGTLDGRFEEAAARISEAGRVYVCGFRAVAGFASSFSIMLSCIRPEVYAVTGAWPAIDFLADLRKSDLVVVMAFPRYSRDAVLAARMAAEAGAGILAVTDSAASPVAEGADCVLPIHVGNFTFFNSYVSLAASMDILAGLVSRQNKAKNEERLMRMEKYLKETGQY